MTWSTCTSRSLRWRLGASPTRRRSRGRDVPHLQRESRLERNRQRARRAPHAQPAARPDRRVRGGGVDRAPLLRWPLPGHPERGARRSGPGGAGGAPAAERQAPPRVRRAGGGAQGSADAAARVRGAARAHPHRADRDRPVDGGAFAADARHARRPRAGQGRRRDQAPGARALRPAVRALARGRELRHGPDRGVCRRHPGRRLEHRRLSRCGPRRRRRSAGAAGRRPDPRRDAARPVGGARAPGSDGPRRRPGRRAVRVAARRGAGNGGLRGGGRDARAGRRNRATGRPRGRPGCRSEAVRAGPSGWPASSRS